tara:strand:+ start:252 stop:647 length:396 start_codon:yes stop_codon:yes gene_type:complete
MKTATNIACVLLLLWLIFGGGSSSAPIDVDRLTVVVVEQSEQRGGLPRPQLAAIMSAAWTIAVDKNGGQWARLDPDGDLSKADQWLVDAAAVPRDSVPWLIVATPSGGTSMAMPADLPATMAAIEKHGGTP